MDALIKTLTLEQIEVNLFLGRSPQEVRSRIFGGQVVAQALVAAYHTIEGRICHSLQSYFIRPGDPKKPVLYQVERSRDGKSFSTRRVIAIQNGEQIFNMACSFHVAECGFDHQTPLPDALSPDAALRALRENAAFMKNTEHWWRNSPIEFRPIDPNDEANPVVKPAAQMVWLRARQDVGDGAIMNQALLAYASDFSLLGTALRPHGVTWGDKLQTASLDHIVWFHRPVNFARWHLYVQDSPSASGARGFNRGALYREDGALIASTAQEGLMRWIG
ncbi:MAG: acyl-CoA thioesterase II [Terricaulis sp.]